MPDIASQNFGHDIQLVFKKFRSDSTPQHTPPPTPTTARARIEALMPLHDRLEARQVMARLGAQMVMDCPDALPRPMLKTAIDIAHKGVQLDPLQLQLFLTALDINMQDASEVFEIDDTAAKKRGPFIESSPHRSRRIRARRLKRHKIEKRASIFDRKTLALLGPIIAALPQNAADVQAIKAQGLALNQKLDRVLRQSEKIAEDTSAQSRDNASPDWDRQYGLEYIRARWRGRGPRWSKAWWTSISYIALRCLRETLTWALGLVSLALPIRLFDRGR